LIKRSLSLEALQRPEKPGISLVTKPKRNNPESFSGEEEDTPKT
jgi:hypothetical protein